MQGKRDFAAEFALVEREGPGVKGLMHRSAASGDSEALVFLLANGFPADLRDDQGRTPLRHAAEAGMAECCAVLVRAGADPRAPDRLGTTPEERATPAAAAAIARAGENAQLGRSLLRLRALNYADRRLSVATL